MDTVVISKRRLCLIHIAMLQLFWFLVLFIAVGFCMKFCREGFEENIIKTGFRIVVVIPFTIGPILTLIIGDLLYVLLYCKSWSIFIAIC